MKSSIDTRALVACILKNSEQESTLLYGPTARHVTSTRALCDFIRKAAGLTKLQFNALCDDIERAKKAKKT